jgi:Cu2+-exporting ATPase
VGSHKDHSTAVLDVSGLQWASEQTVVTAWLRRCPGVLRVEVNPVAQTATVVFDRARTSVAELRRQVLECGYHCAGQSVPAHICDALAEPDPPREHAPGPPSPEAAHSGRGGGATTAVEPAAAHAQHEGPAPAGMGQMGPPDTMMGLGGHAGASMAAMAAGMRNRFIVAAVFSVPILLWSPIGTGVLGLHLPVPGGLRVDVWMLLLSLPVIFYSAWVFFDGAARALRARTLDMMVLVSVAVGSGWLYSVVITLTGGGDVFYEAVTVLAAAVLLGHWLEMRARGRASDAIRALLDLAPPRALVMRNGQFVEVPTADVGVGDLLLVRPGAKIAVDGVVEDGESEVDESVVTGESLPVHKQPGSAVIGATINRNGTLRVRATKIGADTALAQIVQLVQQAQNSKPPAQQLADRAAFWLILVALGGGGLTLVTWLLASNRPASAAFLFAITFVVIACPDALVLATPTAITVGSGLGARRGILVKNAVALEAAARTQVVVMDKTGTLTKGQPEVTDLVTDGLGERELLGLAAAVERESEHPLAEAIVRYADQRGADSLQAAEFTSTPGHGATATVNGHRVAVGNQRLLEREGTGLGTLAARRDELAAAGRTAVAVAVDGKAAGLLGIADAPRETAAAAVAALRDSGVEVAMLTGDNQATAERIAAQLGIGTVIAEVLPTDKAAKVTQLQAGGKHVAMVGDGVNDAPALAQADLGIAIGAGTDVAIETADVVLIRSDPLDVPTALAIGRGTLRKMRQNLGWAIGYNSVALPIAAGVLAPAFGLVLRTELAGLAMSGSTIIVVANALTLKRLRLPIPGRLRVGRASPPAPIAH